jgi:two-component system alkaline phosphatase synthesis response regulator PhoP
MTLLLADDDPITLDSLAECLQPEGFKTLLARDGEEALTLWRQHKPQLMCLDIMMPRLDGYEVCRRVRAVDATLPVLFLSAKSEEIDVVVGLKLGADDFIRKPFGKQELLARIHAALRRSRKEGSAARTFEMNGMRVFPLELRAELGTGGVELTPREVSILQVLHERSGEVTAAGAQTTFPRAARWTSTSPSCARKSRRMRRIRASSKLCAARAIGIGRTLLLHCVADLISL